MCQNDDLRGRFGVIRCKRTLTRGKAITRAGSDHRVEQSRGTLEKPNCSSGRGGVFLGKWLVFNIGNGNYSFDLAGLYDVPEWLFEGYQSSNGILGRRFDSGEHPMDASHRILYRARKMLRGKNQRKKGCTRPSSSARLVMAGLVLVARYRVIGIHPCWRAY